MNTGCIFPDAVVDEGDDDVDPALIMEEDGKEMGRRSRVESLVSLDLSWESQGGVSAVDILCRRWRRR